MWILIHAQISANLRQSNVILLLVSHICIRVLFYISFLSAINCSLHKSFIYNHIIGSRWRWYIINDWCHISEQICPRGHSKQFYEMFWFVLFWGLVFIAIFFQDESLLNPCGTETGKVCDNLVSTMAVIVLAPSTLRPGQNGCHFANNIFKCIFLNENVWTPIKVSLKFVLKGPINNIPALVQIMAWRRPGDKPLSEPMRVRLPTHICVTRPQWVNERVCLLHLQRFPHCFFSVILTTMKKMS